MDLDQKIGKEEGSYVTKNDHETQSLHVTENYFWHIKIHPIYVHCHSLYGESLNSKIYIIYTAIRNAFKL